MAATLITLDLQVITAILAVIAAVVAAVCIGDRKSKRSRSRLPMLPGPRPWPIIGNLGLLASLSGGAFPHQDMANLAKQYGPFMLLHLGSLPVVIVSSSRYAELILKTHDRVFASRPSLSQGRILGYEEQSIFFSPYGSHWRRIRKAFMDLFTPKRVQQFQPVRREEVLSTLHSILDESKAGGAMQLDVKLHNTTSSITAQMMVSKRFFGPISSGTTSNSTQQKTYHMHTLKDVLRLEGSFVVGDYIPFLQNFDPQGVKKEMRAVSGKANAIYDGIIQERRQNLLLQSEGSPPGQSGMLNTVDALLTRPHSANEKPFNDNQLKGILQDIWLAGIDTTSLTLEWTIAELLRNPTILKRTQEELDKVVGRDRLVEESDIPNLQYLRAVVKECSRLHPIVPMIPQQSTEACEVDGYHLPINTRVLINVWAIGRDPAVWDRASEFYPDRFLEKKWTMDTAASTRQEFEMLPFGAGSRICPGRSVGLLMIHYMLAVLLHACDWSLPQGMTPENVVLDEKPAAGITQSIATPIQAIATPRLPHSVIYAH